MRIQDKIEKIVNKPFTIDDLEKIADDYAIEFAEWVGNEWTCDERWSKITETKKLLEIFKK